MADAQGKMSIVHDEKVECSTEPDTSSRQQDDALLDDSDDDDDGSRNESVESVVMQTKVLGSDGSHLGSKDDTARDITSLEKGDDDQEKSIKDDHDREQAREGVQKVDDSGKDNDGEPPKKKVKLDVQSSTSQIETGQMKHKQSSLEVDEVDAKGGSENAPDNSRGDMPKKQQDSFDPVSDPKKEPPATSITVVKDNGNDENITKKSEQAAPSTKKDAASVIENGVSSANKQSSDLHTRTKPPVKKKKTKIKPPKLPTNKNRTKQATVVNSDEREADDAIARPVLLKPVAATKSSGSSKRKAGASSRLPSMSSPGLLIPTTSSFSKVKALKNADGLASPAAIFDHTMSLMGYTTESRTMRPHPGSSVKLDVGDMFDSDVTLSRNFPKLVPDELLRAALNEDEQGAQKEALPQRLIRALEIKGTCNNEKSKPKTMLQCRDMVPLSLTVPYPESFIQKRLEYIGKVNEREQAIVASQDEIGKLDEEISLEIEMSSKVHIPPIPKPPSPPRLSELAGYDTELFEDHHPNYFMKGKEKFVTHLDKDAFHITEGRYFGLSSNSKIDPHFFGPNAPGISGLMSSAAATGLATAHVGGPFRLASANGIAVLEKGTQREGKGKPKSNSSVKKKSTFTSSTTTKKSEASSGSNKKKSDSSSPAPTTTDQNNKSSTEQKGSPLSGPDISKEQAESDAGDVVGNSLPPDNKGKGPSTDGQAGFCANNRPATGEPVVDPPKESSKHFTSDNQAQGPEMSEETAVISREMSASGADKAHARESSNLLIAKDR